MSRIDLIPRWHLATDSDGWALVETVCRKRKETGEEYDADTARAYYGRLSGRVVEAVYQRLARASGTVDGLEAIRRAAEAVGAIAAHVDAARKGDRP